MPQPRALLLDYSGTLIEEVAFDARAGIDRLLADAEVPPEPEVVAAVLERADRITGDVAKLRDQFWIETPWACLTRLIHYPCGIRFKRSLSELEMAFWDACVRTRPMPGASDAVREFKRLGLSLGLVSNSSFSGATLRHELDKHGLADSLEVIVTSADFAVRKPSPLLLEAAAAMLGVAPSDTWFIGDLVDTDIAGAEAAGMRGIHYGPSRRTTAHGDSFTWPEIVMLVRRALDS